MAKEATNLILAVHGHQPVGNFDWVLGEAYAKAYQPFFNVIERHRQIKWTVHLSGPVVEWLLKKHPEMLRRLATLVRRGQVEVLGGGYAEPILCLIPERDALGQLKRFSRQLTQLKLGPIRGAWLTERVWEPSLPRLFRAAGLEYTIVDDHHLRLAGRGDQAAFGYWVTEDAGQTMALFPSSKALRYLVPFKPVEGVIDHLRAQASTQGRALILGDDLEKFGLWPGTSRWVYEEGWLERFCQAIEAERQWLTTYTISQYMAAYPPLGTVYVPCASYEEMLQWSGGNFRNFLTRYPEANTMHKKMLWVSQRLEEARSKVRRNRQSSIVNRQSTTPRALLEAEAHLYRGQGNDATWHGVFGGIYLQHLRSAVYRELLTAERALDRVVLGARSWVKAEAVDLDADGRLELLLRSELMDLTIDAERGGAVVEWDDKTRGLNLVNTMTRRREAYHTKLLEPESELAAVGADAAPQTIHAAVRIRSARLPDEIVVDPYRRLSAIDHLWGPQGGSPQAFARGECPPGGELVERPYRWRLDRAFGSARAVLTRQTRLSVDGRDVPVQLTKGIAVIRRRPQIQVEITVLNLGTAPVTARVASEWNLALKDPHYNRIGQILDARRLIVTDAHADVAIEIVTSAACGCWYFPIETVSDSEEGLERTYQHLNVTLWWTVTLIPRRPWHVTVTQTVRSGGVRAPA